MIKPYSTTYTELLMFDVWQLVNVPYSKIHVAKHKDTPNKYKIWVDADLTGLVYQTLDEATDAMYAMALLKGWVNG